MGLFSKSDVVSKRSVKAVMVPLRDGICSLNKVYESLIYADVHPIIGQCSNYSSIREHIVDAQQSLERSEQQASAGLKSLDKNIEKLIQEEGKLEKKKTKTQRALDNLKTKQTSNENLLRDSQSSLSQARSNLNSTKETLQSQESRRQNAVIVTSVGAGLMLIPIVGWIAGAGMMIGGGIEIGQANQAIEEAEEDVRKSESQVEKWGKKIKEYESKISKKQHDIRKKEDKLKEIQQEIPKVKEKREVVADFQQKVRRAVHLLGSLSGRASVVEHQTRKFILQEPVMKVMEEVMKAAGELAGNQLFYTKDIAKLVDVMRKNSQKLAAICASESKREEDSYY